MTTTTTPPTCPKCGASITDTRANIPWFRYECESGLRKTDGLFDAAGEWKHGDKCKLRCATQQIAKLEAELASALAAKEQAEREADAALNNLGAANVSNDGRLLTLAERLECLAMDIHKLKVSLRDSNQQAEALAAAMNLLGMVDDDADDDEDD